MARIKSGPGLWQHSIWNGVNPLSGVWPDKAANRECLIVLQLLEESCAYKRVHRLFVMNVTEYGCY